jgi:hypothetical protein
VPPLHNQLGIEEGIVAAGVVWIEMRADEVVDIARRQP